MRIPGGNIISILAACLLMAWLAACGGGGGTAAVGDGGGGGIVGTGKQLVLSGEVNGFGAPVAGSGGVIVNGIAFSRSTAAGVSPTPIRFAFDNISTSREDLLRTGMLVTVNGSFDSASGKGSYTAILFSPELRGPLDQGSVDAAAGSCSVLGRTVRSVPATVFDGIAGMDELALRQIQRPELEVSGFLDSQGIIQASRIALKSPVFSGGPVQIKGTTGSLVQGAFTIGGVSVATENAIFVNMSAAELALAGLVVEVRGTLSGATITNARIERKNSTSDAADGDSISIKGVAAGLLSGDSFVMAGADGPLRVTTSGATFRRGKNMADGAIVASGTLLEVEGTVQADGSLAAREVESESQRSVRLEGDLTLVDPSSATLLLNGVSVTVDPGTAIRDNRKTPGPTTDLTLAGLAPGDHLRVDGLEDGNGRVVASQVQRFDATATTILQGPVSTVDPVGRQLIILGVRVNVDSGVELVKGPGSFTDFSSFAAQLATGSTVVKARGTSSGAAFAASSLEIET